MFQNQASGTCSSMQTDQWHLEGRGEMRIEEDSRRVCRKRGILYLESMRRGVMLFVGVTVSNLPGRLYREKKILRQRQHRGCILEHTSQQCRVQSIVPGLHVSRAHSNETMAADVTCCARHCDSFVLANASTRPSTISHHCVVGNSGVSLFRVCQELGGCDYGEENLSHW